MILSFFFFFNDTATTEIYTLSLHDALPISVLLRYGVAGIAWSLLAAAGAVLLTVHYAPVLETLAPRSEEHTSELQSRQYLVCRLLLEKKKKNRQEYNTLNRLTITSPTDRTY